MKMTRDRATVTEHHVEDTAYTKYPGNYYGCNDDWDLEEFKRNLNVNIISYYKGRELELDIIGISPAIANAYRRIMISEVPTMAIEHVFIYNNTSVIQDEMLAHRFGMIPIKADPTQYEWKPTNLGAENISHAHTIVFKLKAKCERLENSDPDKTGRREDLYKDYKVFSRQIEYVHTKKQKPPHEPVHKNILIAKLSGNQEIDVKLHAVKGIGRDHAKFSPVATAVYRLMPDIKIREKVKGEAALRLKESFSEGVIAIEGREKVAKVVNARLDSGSRNLFRHADLKDKVQYELIKEHFIFRVESTGCMPALDILLQSTYILEQKCQYFLEQLKVSRSRIDDSSSMVEGI